jgi:hypothetical protein
MKHSSLLEYRNNYRRSHCQSLPPSLIFAPKGGAYPGEATHVTTLLNVDLV